MYREVLPIRPGLDPGINTPFSKKYRKFEKKIVKFRLVGESISKNNDQKNGIFDLKNRRYSNTDIWIIIIIAQNIVYNFKFTNWN